MSKQKKFDLLKKCRKAIVALGSQEDVKLFDEIFSFFKKVFDEETFHQICSENETDISEYGINQGILENKSNLCQYWRNLDKDAKNKLEILDLNILRYFLNEKYCEYTKGKKVLVEEIDLIVREKLNTASLDKMVK